ncbi:MAG: glycerol-3-phosphate dehydrogenase subunit C [Halobacteriales archaeon]
MSDRDADDRHVQSGEDGVQPGIPTVGSDRNSGDPVAAFPQDERDHRPGTDPCYKCSVCDTVCPVATVDDEFPGPKFQGPEQWRLSRKEGTTIDDSISLCSNCMRCLGACPEDVPLSQLHNELRGQYVADEGTSLRNRLLANYGRLAGIASNVPRLANLAMQNPVSRWLADRVLGIPSEREFPTFATQTFREWWDERGGAKVESENRRVAYFHGDYANYNTPEVARALVRLYEHFGYEIVVPPQRCSGTPMFANGAMDDARRAAEFNVKQLREYVRDGYDVVCSCTSCSMALGTEYPELFDIAGVEEVATATYESIEYLQLHTDLEERLAKAEIDWPNLAYHAPCHARVQGLGDRTAPLFDAADTVGVFDVGDSCSGISGTYGWKSEHYDTSMAVGDDMFAEMRAADASAGLTECPTCAMQMEHGTGYDVFHPLEVLADALANDD